MVCKRIIMSESTVNVSRREFLGGSLLSGAAWMLGHAAFSAEPPDDLDRWILLADVHIGQDRSLESRGIKPAEKFAEARCQFLALTPRPTGLIIAGDCAHSSGLAGDYAVLSEELAPVNDANIPVYMAMGNHDNRERFWAAFPQSRTRSAKSGLEKHALMFLIIHADWFVLDSSVQTGVIPGEMGGPQLAWLANELDKRPDKPALLVAHHYPTDAKDDNGLRDFDALWDVIRHRTRVKAYFFGHSHRWVLGQREGVHFINLPALAWLFEDQPRAWTEVVLGPDGLRLQLHCLDDTRPKNGVRHDLLWRA